MDTNLTTALSILSLIALVAALVISDRVEARRFRNRQGGAK